MPKKTDKNTDQNIKKSSPEKRGFTASIAEKLRKKKPPSKNFRRAEIAEGLAFIVIAVLLFSLPQFMNRHPDSLVGHFIVADPILGAPPEVRGDVSDRMAGTVILITRHDKRTASGYVINKPLTTMTAGELYKKLDIRPPGSSAQLIGRHAFAETEKTGGFSGPNMDQPMTAFWGGPVDPDEAVIIFARERYSWRRTRNIKDTDASITENLYALNNIIAAHSREDADSYKIVFGYAGWKSEQLDLELERGYWSVLPYEHEILFSPQPEELWYELQERLEKSHETQNIDQADEKDPDG